MLNFTKKPRSFRLILRGGLGNQLFQLGAGLHYSRITGKKLVLDTRKLGVSAFSHTSSIQEFDFADLEFSRGWIPGFAGLWYLRFRRVLGKGFFFESELKRPEIVTNSKDLKFVEGYFQLEEYASSVRSELTEPLNVKKPSQWFNEKLRNLETVDPIVVHMRRGDYLKLKDTHGVLSADYYARAVAALVLKTGSRPVWVFSDSPELVQTELKKKDLSNWELVSKPIDVSDAEILVLMSKANYFVISNSTFSWWAAYLSRSKSVIAPTVWARDTKQVPPVEGPKEWARIDSDWQNEN